MCRVTYQHAVHTGQLHVHSRGARAPELVHETCTAPAAPLRLLGAALLAQIVSISVSRSEGRKKASSGFKTRRCSLGHRGA